MPSGYEKSPEYGGPEPNFGLPALLIICAIAAVALYVFLTPRARGQSRTEIYALQERCGKRAEELFQKDFPEDQRKGLETFANHYHVRLNKCFILEENTIVSRVDGKSYTEKLLNLVDVNDNSLVGSFSSLGCEVAKQKCRSEQEFRALIKPYLEE